MPQTSVRTKKIIAWSAHVFTMTGLVWACLAMIALVNDQPKQMWLFLGIALIVDGLDGSIARKVNVQKYAGKFDGAAMDLVIDYLTWTFIPGYFMMASGMFGDGPLGPVMLLLICTSAMFCYANTAMKTSDFYFAGFPGAWNVVALCLWIMDTGMIFNVITSVFIMVITIVPVIFVHPFRVRTLRPVTITAAFAWLASTGILVAQHPGRPLVVEIIWWAAGAWIVGMGLWRTVSYTRASSTSGAPAA